MMLSSKRFLTLIVASIVWLVAVLFFSQDAVHFAEAIALMTAPYLAAESFKPSNK